MIQVEELGVGMDFDYPLLTRSMGETQSPNPSRRGFGTTNYKNTLGEIGHRAGQV